MFDHERQKLIQEILSSRPSATVTELMEELGVSRSTLRRDLVELENRGELLRVHGGAVHRAHIRGEPTIELRRAESVEAKRAIAARAAQLLGEAKTIYIDAGTTCLEVGLLLSARSDLRLFTHSIPLLLEAGTGDARLTCIGGEYRSAGQALVGGLAMQWVKNLSVDVAFVGASGLSSEGLSTTEVTEAATKSGAMACAKRTILVADSSKWMSPSSVCFADWTQVDEWVVDSALPRKGLPKVTLSRVDLSAKSGRKGRRES